MGKYNYLKVNQTFVNPYHFIPVEKRTAKTDSKPEMKNTDDEKKDSLITGKLHCRMIVKTPLAIIDSHSLSVDEKNHKTYSLYRVGGIPTIPGSSIRGMIRSTYETVTNSCFVTGDDDEQFTKRTEAKKPFAPGVLKKEKGTWKLYKATRETLPLTKYKVVREKDFGRYIVCNRERFYNGDYVTYVGEDLTKSDSNNSNQILYIGEFISNKKNESVFKISDKPINYRDEEVTKAFNGLYATLEIYRNESINKGYSKSHSGYENFERARNNRCIPIWYKEENGNLYFSMAAIGRQAYATTFGELVGHKCTNRNKACPACRLFGMVGASKGNGMGSKFRVSDAKLIGKLNKGSTIFETLKELGSPRPGYIHFYSKDGKSYDENGAEIAGRKYYWHIPQVLTNSKIYSDKVKTNRNATCELLNKGILEFDIFFDGITDAELEQLKWVLTLGENKADGKYCHKIGHGKPLGLGSVKVVIDEENLRSFDVQTGYQSEEKKAEDIEIQSSDEIGGFDKGSIEALKIMTDYYKMNNYEVRYPYVVNETNCSNLKDNAIASHQWFNKNEKNLPPLDAPKLNAIKLLKF